MKRDLDSFDFSAIPSLNKQKNLDLARGEWITNHSNICLLVQPGTGKAHRAISRAAAAYRQGHSVRFFTAAALVNLLGRYLTQLDRTDLLIVDELGYLSFSRGGAELMFQVFADR